MKKFLSRKFLVVLATAITNVLIGTETITIGDQALVLKLLNGLAGIYVIVEGIIDGIKKEKPE